MITVFHQCCQDTIASKESREVTLALPSPWPQQMGLIVAQQLVAKRPLSTRDV